MDWTLRRVETEEELEAALALCARILGVDVLERAPYQREDWRERLEKTPELLLYAESGGIPVAAVLGRRREVPQAGRYPGIDGKDGGERACVGLPLLHVGGCCPG